MAPASPTTARRSALTAIGRPCNCVHAKSYYLATANLGYPCRLGRRKIDARLNADNLLNRPDAICDGRFAYVFTGTTYNIPYGTKKSGSAPTG